MNQSVAKIFTVTKDEYDLIDDFIIYYGKIFGYQNLIIIDNMSTDKNVLDVYKKYPEIKIYYEEGYQKDKQGEYFTKYMNMYKNQAKYLIGVDTDEFIYVMNNDESTSYDIMGYLNKLSDKYDMFKIKYYDWSIPNKNSSDYVNYKHTRPVRHIDMFKRCPDENITRKVFYRASNFISTMCGNHNGNTTTNKTYITRLGYFHYSNTGKKRTLERALNICIGYDYVDKNDNKNIIIDKLEIKALKKVPCYGFHRRDELYNFYRREHIINLFVKYVKRFPERKELETHMNKKTTLKEKETEFMNCHEMEKNKNNIFNVTDKEINDFVYNEDVDNLTVGMIIDDCIIIKNNMVMNLIENK